MPKIATVKDTKYNTGHAGHGNKIPTGLHELILHHPIHPHPK